MEEQETRSIDAAIEALHEQIKNHQAASRKILFYVIYFVSFLLIFGGSLYVYQETRTSRYQPIGGGAFYSAPPVTHGKSTGVAQVSDLSKSSVGPTAGISGGWGVGYGGTVYAPNTTILYVFVVLFVVVFGVMMAIYRFHLSEISRYSQLKVGFLRIRIAANNSDRDGFGTEVRHALTKDAFKFQTGKEQKVESPLPGHPTSDIGTLLINKLLDNVDVKVKDKH